MYLDYYCVIMFMQPINSYSRAYSRYAQFKLRRVVMTTRLQPTKVSSEQDDYHPQSTHFFGVGDHGSSIYQGISPLGQFRVRVVSHFSADMALKEEVTSPPEQQS